MKKKEDRLSTTRAILIIRNMKGLHTRPATELVRCAASFSSCITLRYRNVVVNGKSLLGILMLAAEKGSRIIIEATGEDSVRAVQTILALAKNEFYIRY